MVIHSSHTIRRKMPPIKRRTAHLNLIHSRHLRNSKVKSLDIRSMALMASLSSSSLSIQDSSLSQRIPSANPCFPKAQALPLVLFQTTIQILPRQISNPAILSHVMSQARPTKARHFNLRRRTKARHSRHNSKFQTKPHLSLRSLPVKACNSHLLTKEHHSPHHRPCNHRSTSTSRNLFSLCAQAPIHSPVMSHHRNHSNRFLHLYSLIPLAAPTPSARASLPTSRLGKAGRLRREPWVVWSNCRPYPSFHDLGSRSSSHLGHDL